MISRKQQIAQQIDQSLGKQPADLVIKNTHFLNISTGEIDHGDIAIAGDKIIGTYEEYHGKREIDGKGLTVVPGFIDSHVHIESSLVTPFEFERGVLPLGTTTAICDPHEISNVLGLEGLKYFLKSAEKMFMDLFVQLSSCVPATNLETSGATLTAQDLLPLKNHPKVIGLAEMMNYPGLFGKDDVVLDKLVAFDGEHIDGHCPLVKGYELNAYCSCGIRNCHESVSYDEAFEKLKKGMQILVREGSVSKDVEALSSLFNEVRSPFLSLCTDDRNPLDITKEGHLNFVIRKAIENGAPVSSVYRAASWSSAQSFGLKDRGLIAPGYRADLVLLNDLQTCHVHEVICQGCIVSEQDFSSPKTTNIGRKSIQLNSVEANLFDFSATPSSFPVIGVQPNSIVTDFLKFDLNTENKILMTDQERDLLKISVLERHGKNQNVSHGFVKGMQLKQGALASSVGHDSHNVVVIGVDNLSMQTAVNRLIDNQGGFVAAKENTVVGELALPLAGLMSDQSFEDVCERLKKLRSAAQSLGCPLDEPFLQMAFLALPVIPHLKITDYGLVDVDDFILIKH